MEFKKIDETGYRIVGAITELGHLGPKHHAVIIGRNTENNRVYVAENMNYGYQLATYENFAERYSTNGAIRLFGHESDFDPMAVARYALDELRRGGNGAYNLATNNCESFVNRAIFDHSVSRQVVHTALVVTAIVSICWAAKKWR